MNSFRRAGSLLIALVMVIGVTVVSSVVSTNLAHAATTVTVVGSTTLSADPNLKTQAGGIQYKNGTFPDTAAYADGGILFDFHGPGGACSSNTCPAGPTSSDFCDVGNNGTTDGFGPCSGSGHIGYTATGSFEAFTSAATQTGGSVEEEDVGTNHTFSTIYDCGAGCGGGSNSLVLNVSGMPTSGTYGIALYLNNNPGNVSRSGLFTLCVNGSGGTCTTLSSATTVAKGGGVLVEWKITGVGSPNTSITIDESNGGSSMANDPVGGVFFMHDPSGPTFAAHSNLHQTTFHGKTTITWRSFMVVAGFNVFDGKLKLNRRLVIGHNGRYRFVTKRAVHHLRLAVVPLR